MCNHNPHTELMTVWGFTHEEILHRWKIWKAYDPISRLFGDADDEQENKTPVNGPDVMAGIKALFGVDVMNLGALNG